MNPARQFFTKKWISIGAILVLVVLALSMVVSQRSIQTPAKKQFSIPPGSEYVPDNLVVNFAEGKTPAMIEGKLKTIDVLSYEPVFKDTTDPLLKNYYTLTLKQGTSIEEAGQAVNRWDEVKSVEANYISHSFVVPNDTDYSKQWDMKKMKMEEAWDLAKGSQSIIVSVNDTGIDMRNQPDLPAGITGKDFINNDNDPQDDHGHGTHVAGTIGALTNNGRNVSGINWNLKLMTAKVLGSNGSGNNSQIANGIKYAADQGARVINMSLGGKQSCPSIFRDAISYANGKGTVVVVAAGNDNADTSLYSPANCPGSIAVAATTQNDSKASFSNYGSRVDIAAPGYQIISTQRGGGTAVMSGTSMASPHVAGAAGLLLSTNPGLSPQQVRDCLVNSGDPVASNIGGRRLNMLRALQQCGGNITPVPTVIPAPTVTPGVPTLTPVPQPSLTPGPTARPTATPVPTRIVYPTLTYALPPGRRRIISVRCFIFKDNNNNGVADPGEQGYSGAEFSVFPQREYNPTAVTGRGGYCYLVLLPGNYRMIIKQPNGSYAVTNPVTIPESDQEQTISIGIPAEGAAGVPQPTSKPTYKSYECKEPTSKSGNKSLQLVTLQCSPK